MNPAARSARRHRLAGLVLAALGVTLARLGPVLFAGAAARGASALAGVTLAVGGLLVIALGVHRRLRAGDTAPLS